METGSLGERKIEANTAVALGQNANLLVSASVFNNAGAHQLYVSELDAPQNNFGRAIDMDGEKGYHLFADLTWGHWEALAVAGDRIKIQPISWGTHFSTTAGPTSKTRADSSNFPMPGIFREIEP